MGTDLPASPMNVVVPPGKLGHDPQRHRVLQLLDQRGVQRVDIDLLARELGDSSSGSAAIPV